MQKQRRKHPAECPSCQGFGQTRETATLMERQPNGKLKTVQRGSGCLKCLGTGRVAHE